MTFCTQSTSRSRTLTTVGKYERAHFWIPVISISLFEDKISVQKIV